MNLPKMTDAIGLIDDQLISDAITFPGPVKKTVRIKWVTMAACLCLAVIGAVAGWGHGIHPGRTGTEKTDPTAVIQVSLSRNASDSEDEAESAIRLVSAKDGLCLAADGEASDRIAVFVAPDDTQDHRSESMSLEEAEALAYLDLDSAEGEMKEKILEARRTIIFSMSWVADGFSGCVQNVKTGEIILTLPSFSELFPDWDIPEFPNTNGQITVDGLGTDCLYGLTMKVITVNETSLIGTSQEPMNMFDTNAEITVFLPENTAAEDLGLKTGDIVFISYYGSGCSLAESAIKAYTIEKTD